MNQNQRRQDLERLATLHGIGTAYVDVYDVTHTASDATLLRLLAALGAPVASMDDVPDALRLAEREKWRQIIEPVWVSWDGEPIETVVRVPADWLTERHSLEIFVADDSGDAGAEMPAHTVALNALSVREKDAVDGGEFVAVALRVPHMAGIGYHRVRVIGRRNSAVLAEATASLIVAPTRAWTPGEGAWWGVFSPVWALHSRHSLGGVGDYSDLRRLAEWVGTQQGHVVATLPILPTFLDEPFDPSPYMPTSRLAWSEFYIDLAELPEMAHCPAAREILDSPPMQALLQRQHAEPTIDYRSLAHLRYAVLRELAAWFFAHAPAEDRAAFDAFIAENPHVADYARFRAIATLRRQLWREWPERLRDENLDAREWHEPTRQMHLYAQWRADRQLGMAAQTARQNGLGLLLDYPLGVHPDGYDAWRERECFLENCSTGAPPDLAHTNGQDWGFAPLHPARIRAQGYRYFIASIRHHLRHAGVLRIDHVMGLSRLWCVPNGMGSANGAYIYFRPEEVYAILAIESQHARCLIVGEDLGTVPPDVPAAMERHDIYGLRVLQRLLIKMKGQDVGAVIASIPASTVTSVNTHDMPMFSGFIEGADLADSDELGLLAAEQIAKARPHRKSVLRWLHDHLFSHAAPEAASDAVSEVAPIAGIPAEVPPGFDANSYAMLVAALEALARSRSRILLVTLEDLWCEPKPQNVPGTVHQRPNWRRRMRAPLEVWTTWPCVLDALRRVRAARQR